MAMPWLSHKDGEQLLTGSITIRTWDVATGKPIKELNIAPREMHRPIFDRDATMAAIIPINSRDLEIIDVTDGKVLLLIPEYWGYLSGHVDFSPDGKTLVASTWSGLVQIWDIRAGGAIRTFRQRDRTSRDQDRAEARFSPDGEYVICRELRKDRDPNFNERFVIWKVSDGTAVASIDKAYSVALTPDNRHALLWRKYDEIPGAPRSHTVSLHDLRTENSMRWISRDVEGEGRAISPDGKWLAVVKEHVLERTGHADRFTIQLLAVPERVEPHLEIKSSEAMPSKR